MSESMPDFLQGWFEQVVVWVNELLAAPPLAGILARVAPDSWDMESGIVAFSTVATLLAVILVSYTLVKRLITEAGERRENQLRQQWLAWISEYLVGEEEAGKRIRALRGEAFRRFVGLLTEYLTDLEGEDRNLLASLLVERGYTRELGRMLRKRDEGERAFAARLLGLLRAEEHTPALRKLLHDRSETVRFAAASALMQIHDLEAVPALFLSIGRNPLHHERLRCLLFEFGPRLLPTLGVMLTEETVESWELVTILEVMRASVYTEKSMEILYLATTTSNREVRIAAIKALASFEDPMLQGFFEDSLSDEDPVIQATAAIALAAIGSLDVIPMLAELLEHENFWVVKAAAESLTVLGEDALELLRNTQGSEFPMMTRQLVGEALASRDLQP